MNARPDPATISPGLARGHADFRLARGSTTPALNTVPRHQARDLTGGGTLARIDLDGQVYSLRITRAGKLILTK